ncbi:hypothetical protein GCM10028810_46440 [Spirosoma litoris]
MESTRPKHPATMKIVLMITTLCLGSAFSFAQVGATTVADEQRVQTTLRQVTVFLTRAQLSSHAMATLEAGTKLNIPKGECCPNEINE